MRFPSVAAVARRARQTAVRFPFALLSGAVVAVAMMALIESPGSDWRLMVFATALLGLPLFTALATTAERRRVHPPRRWLAAGVLAVGLILLAVWSRSWPDGQAQLRFLQLLLVAHLTVAVLPFAREESGNGFWQFNRFLLLQYLIAAFYTAVLFVGLALALAAVDQLFGADVPGEAYGHLMALLAFVFHPWFMLAGVPDDYERLDALEEYPIGLKVFAQFVLLPLVTVYLVILTTYLGKVLVTRAWPSGWIGWLVSGVSAVGVLALLLLHPIRNRVDSRWVNGYGRWYFLALLPSLGMLLVAIGKRIGQYGVTEPRYFLLVLAVWLAALAVFYVVTGSRNIKPIPVTLAVVALVTAWGPWGAYATSRRSQLNRMGAILAANGMGSVGAAVAPRAAVSFDDRRELSAVLSYLRRLHGPRAVAVAIGVPVDSASRWPADSVTNAGDQVEEVAMHRLGIEFVDRWARNDNQGFSVSAREAGDLDIAGYDLMRRVSLTPKARIEVGSTGLALSVADDMRLVEVTRLGAPVATLDIAGALSRAGIEFSAGVDRRVEPLIVEAEADGMGLRLILNHMSGGRRNDELGVLGASGYLLVRLPRPTPEGTRPRAGADSAATPVPRGDAGA